MSTDDELMADLRRIAAETDPVPRHVSERARAALATRSADAELAALLLDSTLRPDLVRGTDDVRLLSFESATVSVELQVTAHRRGHTVVGLLVGAAGEVVADSAGTRRSTTTGPDGWFTFADLPSGPTRLHVLAEDGTNTVTSWTSL
ncbi:carboxypeptidase-like regulatory domain-containing protein [Amycolatopsis sp. cg5]|uniref:carboxypeptidase-like regulatory domain-containing protein n=1 Tax=Amycolatopsis sp. cg5 TaxID=3238802 RepID=UPI003526C211